MCVWYIDVYIYMIYSFYIVLCVCEVGLCTIYLTHTLVQECVYDVDMCMRVYYGKSGATNDLIVDSLAVKIVAVSEKS